MTNRYLLISDEQVLEDSKLNRHTHFDIICSSNIDEAIKVLKRGRPNIENYTHLSLAEIAEIHRAMIHKTDIAIRRKFKENTSENLHSNTST